MENASKALIIAGAILLSILLISLGIMIFSQAQDTVNNSGMSQAEINTFNSQFTKYEGTRKGSEVKSLIGEVIASNADETHKNNKIEISVTIGSTKYEKDNIKTSLVSTTNTYTVECGTSGGRVNNMTIKTK